MAKLTPAFYSCVNNLSKNGISTGDIHRILYNIFQALYGLCNNIDNSVGVIGNDYRGSISTPLLATVVANDLPPGPLDSVAGAFYTPGQVNWDGVRQPDAYAIKTDILTAIGLICAKLDADAGGSLDTNFMATIGTPLSSCLSAALPAPPEGLISGTYFYGLESYIAHGSFSQGDLYKCGYNFYQAIVRICTMLDAGAGTLPQNFVTSVGTPLNTAVGQFIQAPASGNTITGT